MESEEGRKRSDKRTKKKKWNLIKMEHKKRIKNTWNILKKNTEKYKR